MPDKKLQTWQIWHAMRKILGDDFVMAVLGRRKCQDHPHVYPGPTLHF